MTAPSPEKWKCHVCQAGPHLCATTLRCTGVVLGAQCPHEMCKECKKDGNITPPLAATGGALRSPPNPATTLYTSATMPRTVPDMAPARGNDRDRDRGKYHQPAMRLSSRPPPLTGWWICSNCESKNNPDLSPSRCVMCNHTRCPRCRPWRR